MSKFFLKNVNKQLKSAEFFFSHLSHKKFHKTKSSWRWKLSTRARYFSQKIKNEEKKFFSLFLIFWPKFLALVDNFQRQEDLLLWNFLCNQYGKKWSADFSCLFTFFRKKLKSFQILLLLGQFHYKLLIMVNFQIHEIFIKNFGGVALGLKFQKLKIHHNQVLIIKLSQW